MDKKWWKEGVVYQIYPRSFKDSNGDGIGDLRGVIEKLDYLKELGITIVWLNPVYKSPNDDNGYDISDYRNIMMEFGTMADWEELLSGMHERGIRLIMDLVVNHTSDEHNWFIESRKSRENPYRDYYIWRKPVYDADGNRKPPNNWTSFFSGSAWEFDEGTGEYYLHLFSKRQPDLNWENDKVRNEIYEMMNWWFGKGVDGFRMDVINLISKYPGFPDFDYTIPPLENKTFFNGPRLHEFVQEMNRNCMQKYDVMTVGECGWMTIEEGKKLIGKERNELNMIFQMDHVILGEGRDKWDYVPWKLTELKKIIKKWDDAISECDGWGSNFLMNHDQPRSVSKFGNDKEYRVESAKMLAVFTMSLRGTPYIYQGDEIGMTNIKIDDINDYRDIEILNHYKLSIENGKSHEKLMEGYNRKGRDNSRTPMQWNDSENAGFTTGNPWIKVNPDYVGINVEKDRQEKNSIFNFYKKMIKFRLKSDVLAYGDYIPVLENDENIFAFYRKTDAEKLLVILNFSADDVIVGIMEKEEMLEMVISNYEYSGAMSRFRPYEAKIYRVSE